MKKDIYIIIGETATGKTSLSIDIATNQKIKNNDSQTKKIEIINADQTQFYKELNYSVCKITESEQKNIKHHLLSHLSLKDNIDINYNVNDFKIDCKHKIAEIIKKNKIPVLVGGSHYYIYKILYDTNTESIKNKDNLNYLQKYKKPVKSKTKYLLKLQLIYYLLKIYTILKFVFLLKIKYLNNLPYPLITNNSDINNIYRLESYIKILKNNYINKLCEGFFDNKKSLLWQQYNIKIIYTKKYQDLIKENSQKYKKILQNRWHDNNNNLKENNLYRAFLEFLELKDKQKIQIQILTKKALVFNVFYNLQIQNENDFLQKYDKILTEIINQDYKYAKKQNVYIKKYFKQYMD